MQRLTFTHHVVITDVAYDGKYSWCDLS